MSGSNKNQVCFCGSGKKYKKCCGTHDSDSYKNICLLVGNGIVIDLVKKLNVKDLNPSKPLSNFCNEDIDYSRFIDKIPVIKDGLIPLKDTYKDEFIAINDFISSKVGSPESESLFDAHQYCNTRRFLATAYSMFYLKLKQAMKTEDIAEWNWNRWLKKNSKKIKLAISFNYDLLLEASFNKAGRSFQRIGTIEDKKLDSVAILKPHGSIDFDMKPGLVGAWDCSSAFIKNQMYGPLDEYAQLNILPEKDWLKCRMQADLIPPLQKNDNDSLDWVKEIFKYYQSIVREIDAFIIAGFSYSKADRPEINKFVDACSENRPLDFFVVNPNPSVDIKELIQYIESKGHNVIQKKYLPWY